MLARLARLASLALLAACVGPPARPPILYPEVQLGPGSRTAPVRVLVLSPSCGSIEARCPPGQVAAVDAIAHAALEMAGYTVVERDHVRITARQRREETARERETRTHESATLTERGWAPDTRSDSAGVEQRELERHTVVLDGPGFDDLTPAERQDARIAAGADGVVSVRIVLGAPRGAWAPSQTAEVLVKLAVDGGETLAWVSRCAADSVDFGGAGAALEHAARCAIRGATGR